MTASRQEILIAARRKLIAAPAFAALIGTDVGKDPAGGGYPDAWLFRAVNEEMTPNRNPRNTGTSSVVLGMRSPWTNPNRHSTLEFPELSVRIFSDMTRGTDHSLSLSSDAEYRCDRVARAIKTAFNNVANNDHFWPNGVYVVSCVLWSDLRVDDIPNDDGLVSGDLSFALEIG